MTARLQQHGGVHTVKRGGIRRLQNGIRAVAVAALPASRYGHRRRVEIRKQAQLRIGVRAGIDPLVGDCGTLKKGGLRSGDRPLPGWLDD